MLTATTRCGNRSSPPYSSSPFHFRVNTILGPLPFTQRIPFQISPMNNVIGTVSLSYPTRAPFLPSPASRWKNFLSWNVRRPSDAHNTSYFTPKRSVEPNARLPSAYRSALAAPRWPPPRGPSPLVMATSSFPTIERMPTLATRRARTSADSAVQPG